MENEIRIVIVDDHPIVRQGLRQMIESDRALKIVAEAGDGQTALEQIQCLQPDLAVLDIDMPRMDGFAVAREIIGRKLPVEIIFLTIHRDEELFQAALDLGAKGYVLKDSAVTDIIAGIKAVASGRHYLSPALSPYLLKRRAQVDALNQRKPGINSLTPTERRILKLIAEEKTSKEIAEELFISPRTVETHRANITRKLDLRGSLALIKFAVTHRSELS
ncbi:MAG TPA: response regulator transcription factor [Blastocatellia bacterium]|nr:response regulator transcription factor [Blastocatellia bacterium]